MPNITYIVGTNYITEAISVCQKDWKQSDSVIIASGESFPDALAGSVLGYKTNQPIMLFDKDADNNIKKFLLGCKGLAVISSGFSKDYLVPDFTTPIGVERVDAESIMLRDQYGKMGIGMLEEV